jgi:hypothetical protein
MDIAAETSNSQGDSIGLSFALGGGRYTRGSVNLDAELDTEFTRAGGL